MKREVSSLQCMTHIHILSINNSYTGTKICADMLRIGENLSLEKQRKKSSRRETKDTIITMREVQELVKKMQSLTQANSANFKEGNNSLSH